MKTVTLDMIIPLLYPIGIRLISEMYKCKSILLHYHIQRQSYISTHRQLWYSRSIIFIAPVCGSGPWSRYVKIGSELNFAGRSHWEEEQVTFIASSSSSSEFATLLRLFNDDFQLHWLHSVESDQKIIKI
jgi:hypothetical protein